MHGDVWINPKTGKLSVVFKMGEVEVTVEMDVEEAESLIGAMQKRIEFLKGVAP